MARLYSGPQLLKQIEMLLRSGYNTDTPEPERRNAIDYYLYAWCGPDSPLFDKSKILLSNVIS